MRLLRSACAGVAAVVACALGAAPAFADTVVIDAVNVPNPAFQPANAPIDAGDTVRWEFDLATTTHTVTSSSSNWSINETRDPLGAAIERTFDTAGVYMFLCLIHTGMTGSVTVQDSPTPDPDPDPIPDSTPPASQPDAGAPRTEPRVAATIGVPRGARAVGARRLASVATLRCPSGGAACAVSAPKHVTVPIAGRRYRLSVLAPRTVRPGRQATVRVRLPNAAATRLAGRRASVTLRLSVTREGRRTSRAVTITITRKAA